MSLPTRWRTAGRWTWRVGLMRREWWIGVRYDFAPDVWVIGFLGLVMLIRLDGP